MKLRSLCAVCKDFIAIVRRGLRKVAEYGYQQKVFTEVVV